MYKVHKIRPFRIGVFRFMSRKSDARFTWCEALECSKRRNQFCCTCTLMICQGNNYWVLGLSLYFFAYLTKRKSQGFLVFWQCFHGLPLGVEVTILIVIDDRRILRPCAAAFQDLRSWGHAAVEKEGPESGTRRTFHFLGFFSCVVGCFSFICGTVFVNLGLCVEIV